MSVDNVVNNLRAREIGLKTNLKRKNKKSVANSLRRFAEDRAAKPDTNKSFEMSRKAKSTLVIELSPDGKFVASSHGDHTIRISEISTGKCIKTLVGHTRSPWTMSFHSTYIDVLASGCIAGEVRVWDLKSGESDCWSFPDKKAICSVSFHPILPILIIAVADRIYAWDWTAGRPYHLCTAPKPDQIRWLKFHPTGNWLYTGISNGFVAFNSNSRQTSGNSYFWQFLHGERSRWRTNNNNNAENNNDDDDNDDEDRLRGIFVLGHHPRTPSRDSRSDRGSRRGVFVPSGGEREESSGEDDGSDDYLVFPTRGRNQDRVERHRRYRSPFITYTRDRTGSESASRPRTSNHDYLGQVRDIWQQRLGRRLGMSYRGDGRSRDRTFPEGSPDRSSEGNGLEERVIRRLTGGYLERPFRRLSSQRDVVDQLNPEPGPSNMSSLSRDPQQNRRPGRYYNTLGGQEREETPTTSSSNLTNNSWGNDSLRRILDIDWQNPHWSNSEANSGRSFPTSNSGTSFQSSSRAESGTRMTARSSRRSALLRSDPILSDYGSTEEPLFIRSGNQDLEAAGTSDSTNNNNESSEDDVQVLDLSMNLEVEVNNAASSSSGAVSSGIDGARRSRSSEQGGDPLQVEVEEHLSNITDMTMALRSRINRLREYIDEIDAAAAPGAVEPMNMEVTPREDMPTMDDLAATGHGTSMEVVEGADEDQPPSSNMVQLGTLNDLFAAALGGDNGLSGLDEPMPSTSRSVTEAGGQEGTSSGTKGFKRRRSVLSSDEEGIFGPQTPHFNRPYDSSDPATLMSFNASDNAGTGEEAGESTQQLENSGNNSSFAAVSSEANTSSTLETLVNTSSHSNASSSSSSSSQRDDNQASVATTEPSAPMEGSSRTMPVAVVFTFNSPTLSPTRFTRYSNAPRTSSRVTGPERDHNPARQSSPFRSLGNREEFVAIGNDPEHEDDDDDDEIDSGSTDSIARDHNYIPFSRGGGSSRRLNLSSSSNEGPSRNDRNSRMTFMETFFLRRRRDAASTSSRAPTVSRPHAYMFNPSLRHRFRVPTPPRNVSSGNSGTSSGQGNVRRRSFWRFFNSSTAANAGRGGEIGSGGGDDDDEDLDYYWMPEGLRRVREQLRRRNQRYLQSRRVGFGRYEEPDDDDDDDDDDIGRMDGGGAGVRMNHTNGSDDDIPLFGSRNMSNQLPRMNAETDGRSRLFDFTPSFSSEHSSFRIQAWNFNSKVCIDPKKVYKNIVVPYASIHSDASVDISQDGRILCTFVVTEKTVTQRKEVGLFSLEPSTLGDCLCFIELESTAISLSLSPNNQYLLVGVSMGRYELTILKPVIGSIYKLRMNNDKELTADFVSDVTHLSSDWTTNSIDFRIAIGANCARWFLGSGEGFVYGTNKGDMVARSHKLYNPDLWPRRDRENQDRMGGDQGGPWSWLGPGQMRLADFLIWSAQNNMNIGPVIV